jgi:DnaJ like chaperone protein
MSVLLYIVIIGLVIYFLSSWIKRASTQKSDKQSNPEPNKARRKIGYGKWIGGGLGWAFGGPIGGIMGFVFGSMYDGMQSGKYDVRSTQVGDFSVSLLVLAAAVMKADGKVLKSELEYVRGFFIRQFGEEEGNNKILLLREIIQQEINVRDVSLQIRQYMEYPSRLQLLHFLFGISSADGSYHAHEVEMIRSISGYLGIRQADFNSIRAMFVKDTDSAYKILEITADASNEEVKKAYHRMAIKYHPDKVAHLGEDIRNAAKEKFQKLNAAYGGIKKQRGMN